MQMILRYWQRVRNVNSFTGLLFMYGQSFLIRSKVIPVTGRGGLYGCEMLRIPHCLDKRLTAVRLSVLRTGRALLPRNIIFLLLVLISVRG
jgi:hypothetical protein